MLRVGIAGLGTIGGGTVRLLRDNADLIADRCGRPIVLTAVAERDAARAAAVDTGGCPVLDDGRALAERDDVDLVVELIGGEGGVALEVARNAIARGRHVVTANKAMIARHGWDLAAAAEKAGVALAFEAAVAGGIPILAALREGLAANRIRCIHGILNGTCNYILTAMQGSGRDFGEVLAEAQALGYAEADPSFDVDGVDTAHKTAILAALAFGRRVDLDSVSVEGIRAVAPVDLAVADQFGYRIKLLGVVEETAAGVVQRVQPSLVAEDEPVARVAGVFNAVVVDGDFVGRTVFQGRGAGAEPTASAVVADMIAVARGGTVPAFGRSAGDLAAPAPATAGRGRFYLRFTVAPGADAVADIAAGLRGVPVENIFGGRREAGAGVPVIVTTFEAEESAVRAAMDSIARSAALAEPPVKLRIETF